MFSIADRLGTSSDEIRIKKTHLYVAGGVAFGIILGLVLARTVFLPTTAVPASAVFLSGEAPSSTSTRAIDVATDGRPSRGPTDARVTIVEFTDYQCPFCGRHFQQTLPLLLREYSDRVRYVIRNMPLTALHPNAQRAAEAAECANDQTRFWDYHDLLFSHQNALADSDLKNYATELGLDMAAFARCLDSGAKVSTVARDVEDGRRYGITGTPTFFVNGKALVGAQPYAVFKTAIDEALR